MTETEAKRFGHLAWVVDTLLRSSKRAKGQCSNLILARKFESGELAESENIDGAPDTVAVNGELLKVDCHLIDSVALCGAIFIFLRAAFDPVLIGAGKALVVWDETLKSVVFLGDDYDVDMDHSVCSDYETNETPNVEVSGSALMRSQP